MGRPPTKTTPDSTGHYAEWLKSCRKTTPTTCTFDYSSPLTETVLLGNTTYRVGHKFNWQAEGLRVADDTAATELQQGLSQWLGTGYEEAGVGGISSRDAFDFLTPSPTETPSNSRSASTA